MARSGVPKVVVVGPCASGKSTLVAHLQEAGINAYWVAQEHSIVSGMFRRREPDLVIYLDISEEGLTQRRDLVWFRSRLDAQKCRLARARLEADLIITTDDITPMAIRDKVLAFIERMPPCNRKH